ncbi:hypothetical protein AVT64_gp39 [Acinetobacter phage YMC11/12/R2315]|uniref:Terminase small subunit n=3 Tax=Obolenskvirus AbC62 TaxID=1915206 RepID=A0A0D4DCM2_9CAUD|nr:hypothetical protein LD30_gp01 [Acinetobacter phage YMC-13-01-C62]YP_009203558.1 hypothetical protein AVT64_gp39 [Acinetobacter phage YMC11/12/R2315]AJT61462.1 hypothetical protein ABA1215_00660 [Acinetobacter phage YMC11/12/R1215]WNT46011.1 hypothetical protein [Acinetobacter phage P115]AID17915.1 hypothetical protein BPABA14_00010 [Acinetobacter phage YMC-13-01-C62]AJT61270.1 hypothetical protein ABA2315_00390 [Acinetobacter phage YMC11/12/R2315]
MSNEVGRPSGLTPELIEKAKEYLITGYKEIENIVPSIAGLGCYLGIGRSTIYEYKALSPEFADTLDAIMMKQEMLLINGGLSQQFSGTITKLMLANHGYSDKVETDITSNGESVNKPTVINLVGKIDSD